MHINLRSAAALACFLFGGCGGNPAGGGGDGTIYYSTVDYDIWQLKLGDGSITKLIRGNQPDRTAEGSFVYILNDLDESADGITVKTIVKEVLSPTGYNNNFEWPRISPDGTLVAYQDLSVDGFVYVVKRADGSLVSHFPVGGGATTGWSRPSWTQDGRLVSAGGFANPGLYISDAGFTKWTRFDPMLSMPSEPSVSPDGKKVAFIINNHVATINLDGTGLQVITTGNGQESFPAWSPDGKQIAAWNQYTLITFNADGTGTAYDVLASHPETSYNFLTDIPFCWR